MSKVAVRRARFSDVSQIVALIERRREEYQVLAPLFWRKAANSARSTQLYYRWLIFRGGTTMLVAEQDGLVLGFLVAMRARVPPVFDPGPTMFVDDFYVAAPDRWADVGALLFTRLREIAVECHWRQLIVVSGTGDEPKNGFLSSVGLSPTSTWWTGAA